MRLRLRVCDGAGNIDSPVVDRQWASLSELEQKAARALGFGPKEEAAKSDSLACWYAACVSALTL
eukprot:COSAG05_NODE_147_length_16383_cov_266.102555_16_plen_65_part_00